MSEEKQQPYRVLARKYRSQSFSELIGQDALVQTLTNAIESNRIAQAYMLTGIRGVGKTSTARLIAKALNHQNGPTAGPTDDCPICKAITEDRHPDVLEMDAASRTGVDNIRELIDSVRYAPTEARYKVYIIDEVHMLSTQAFNALLKTLEEPPPHVVFIFATTEIRKVPITILSRCQRFDLRRIDQPTLFDHYKKIAGLEKVDAEDDALTMIARAADGSVRDGLSLLDQAIAMSDGKITTTQIRDMLGLADQSRTTDLLQKIFEGNIKDALAITDDLYKSGSQANVILEDLLAQTHALTRIRTVGLDDTLGDISGETATVLEKMAGDLSMPSLARTWQILLKGLKEIAYAPKQQTALEMIIMRLCYTSDLPDPADLIKKLKKQPAESAHNGMKVVEQSSNVQETAPVARIHSGEAVMKAVPKAEPVLHPQKLEDIVALLEQNGKFQIASQIIQYVRLVRFEDIQIEFALEANAPKTLPQDLTQNLRALTGKRWLIIVSDAVGEDTISVKRQKAVTAEIETAKQEKLVKETLQIFPEAEITRIYSKEEEY